jgi:hypothetical protein
MPVSWHREQLYHYSTKTGGSGGVLRRVAMRRTEFLPEKRRNVLAGQFKFVDNS